MFDISDTCNELSHVVCTYNMDFRSWDKGELKIVPNYFLVNAIFQLIRLNFLMGRKYMCYLTMVQLFGSQLQFLIYRTWFKKGYN